MARREIPRELSIYINDKQVVNSFRGITSEISRTNNELKNLNRNSETYNEDLERLKEELEVLTQKQKEFKDELNGTNQSFGDGIESLKKFYASLVAGDLVGAKEALDEIGGSIKGMTKSALAFIATPLGAAIAVLAGIVIGTKYLFEFNKELEKSNDVLRSFGVAAEEMSNVRSEIQATAETFEKEFDEIASKANSLSKSYGISMSEANDIIANGLANGGSKNDEFLDSLGEYDEFFSKAGYSAQEFVDILNKGFDVGIYSDKLPDALKEADLSLKEQTKATRDALTNAFGESFTDEILARVATGQITTKKALEDIAVQAKKTGLTQQQQAQLTADVFKGAGEDAGGALKILEVVGQSAQKEMSASTKAQLELLEANKKLNKAQAELFEIKDFGTMWDAIKAQVIDAFASALLYIRDFKNDIQPLIDIIGVVLVGSWVQLKLAVVTAFDIIGSVVKLFFDNIKSGFKIIKAIFTGDFRGAINLIKEAFINFGNTISNLFVKLKNNILTAIISIVENTAPLLSALGLDVDAILKKLESFKSKEVVIKTTTDKDIKPDDSEQKNTKATAEELAKQKALRDAARQKEAEARKRAADKKRAEEEKAAKEELDRMLALAKAKSDVAKAELNLYIATNRSKLDSSKKLSPEIIAEETNRLERIKDMQLNALAEDRLSKVEKAQADAKSNEEFLLLKLAADLEYEAQRQTLELNFQVTTDDLKKQYSEEQKQLRAEQLLADNELALIEAENKFEFDKIKQQQDYDQQLAGYKKLYEDKKITEAEYIRFKEAAARQQAEIENQRQLQQIQMGLGGLNTLASALGEMFGQTKQLAIVQANISGAQAVLSIWQAPAALPQPYDAILKGVLTAANVIQTGAQIKTIQKQKAPKTPKFFYGGFTGNSPHLGYDEFGTMTGIVHENEYVIPKVMTQNPRYANTIAWIEQERTGKRTKKFNDGGGTSPNAIPESVMYENDSEMKGLLRAILFRLENPIAPNLIMGYDQAKAIQDLNDERTASSQNGVISE